MVVFAGMCRCRSDDGDERDLAAGLGEFVATLRGADAVGARSGYRSGSLGPAERPHPSHLPGGGRLRRRDLGARTRLGADLRRGADLLPGDQPGDGCPRPAGHRGGAGHPVLTDGRVAYGSQVETSAFGCQERNAMIACPPGECSAPTMKSI